MDDFYKNFRKQLLTASLVGLVIAVSSSANATFQFNLFGVANLYVGAGLGYNKHLISKDFSGIVESANNQGKVRTSTLNLLVPLLGIQINDKYGIEAGYSIHSDLKFSGNQSGSLKIRNYFLDFMGYFPLQIYPIDLLAGAGIGRMHINEKSLLGAIIGNSYNKFGFRVKGGLQYPLDHNLNLRGLIAYQRVGDRGVRHAIKTMRSINVDLIYLI